MECFIISVMFGCFLFLSILVLDLVLEKSDRLSPFYTKQLFNMIYDLPTVFKVVNGTAQTNQKEKSIASTHSSTKAKSNLKPPPPPPPPPIEKKKGWMIIDKEDDEEHGETLCGSCGENDASDEFWIGCNISEKWFTGKCVNITPGRAENMKQYK